MTDSTSFAVGPDTDPDKYRLLRQVGGGGEAEIWQATVSVAGDSENVAVKILRDAHAIDAEAWQERWSAQVELLRLLRHPGVVGVHEYFAGPRMHRPDEADTQTRHHYLVMNWIEGIDLRQWSGRDRADFDRFEALRHLTQIADVLDWLHSGKATTSNRPVVHGDISPGNIIVNANGQAVLVDFGLFRMAQAGDAPPTGTQGYCAPEVLARGEYTAAADRYGFGALAYFVLTGANPPTDATQLRTALNRDLGPMFGAVDLAALVAIASDDPDERPTAGAWMRTLWPHASTAVPRERPLPPPRPGNEFIPQGRDTPVTAVPAMAADGHSGRSSSSRSARPGTSAPAATAPVRPRADRRTWPWVVGAIAAVTVVLCLGGTVMFAFMANDRWDGHDSNSYYDESPNHSDFESSNFSDSEEDLLFMEPSDAKGFSEQWDDDKRLVADCDDDPYVEYKLDRDYDVADVDIDINAGMDDQDQQVTAKLTGDGDELDTLELTGSGPLALSGDVSGVDVLRVSLTGAKSGQCVIHQGTLERAL
jgi:serine/threonine protein kinase